MGPSWSLMDSRIPPSILALRTFSTKWRIASSKRQEIKNRAKSKVSSHSFFFRYKCYSPTFVFSFAEVMYHSPILFSLQNLTICSVDTATCRMSHLFARRTTGMLDPSGSVTFSLKSLSHFFIDWKVAAREISKTNAAATLIKIRTTGLTYRLIRSSSRRIFTWHRRHTRICSKPWSYIQISRDRRYPWK